MPEIDYPQPRLEDDLIALRPPREADVGAVTAACRDPLVARYTLVPSPYGEDDAREWFREAERQRREGSGLHLLAVDLADDRVMASVAINAITWQHRVGQIGYWVAPEARRRGVASSSVRLLSRWALGSPGLARVEIRVDVENGARRRRSPRRPASCARVSCARARSRRAGAGTR